MVAKLWYHNISNGDVSLVSCFYTDIENLWFNAAQSLTQEIYLDDPESLGTALIVK